MLVACVVLGISSLLHDCECVAGLRVVCFGAAQFAGAILRAGHGWVSSATGTAARVCAASLSASCAVAACAGPDDAGALRGGGSGGGVVRRASTVGFATGWAYFPKVEAMFRWVQCMADDTLQSGVGVGVRACACLQGGGGGGLWKGEAVGVD